MKELRDVNGIFYYGWRSGALATDPVHLTVRGSTTAVCGRGPEVLIQPDDGAWASGPRCSGCAATSGL